MEFNRGTSNGIPQSAARSGRRKHFDWEARAVRIEWFIFTALASILLLVAIGWLMFSNNTPSSEYKLVKTNEYQAVFLNGGATSGAVAYTTYFGHITKLNNNYVILKDVYYLTTSSSTDQSQSANPQLTKLGCQQLHSPEDEMVVNRSQVAFWENLQDSGKVVQAIKTFQQQNPNGPNCSTNNSSSTNSTTNTQNNTTTPQSTTNNKTTNP